MVGGKSKSFARGARLAHLGASLAGGYLAHQLTRPFLSQAAEKTRRKSLNGKQARQIREELQNLRGPVMKLGQALSMQTHALGPEWIAELSQLQMQAPPMHPTLMRAQFKSAFGKYPEEVFRSFESTPFAAASLGQVHWAVTREGDEVAVKIQYPAIRESIDGDFNLLQTAGFAARLTGHLPGALIREVRRGILEETDYLREADNLEHFKKALAPLPFMRVPKVYRELSNGQVLTMSRVTGLRLTEFLDTKPPQALRDHFGAALTRLFFFQLFRVRALHADPHPGNYLFNGDGTLGLVDFGCVKHLKAEAVRCYAQFWSRGWLQDDKMYLEIIRILFGRDSAAKDPRIRRAMEEINRFYDEFHPLTENPEALDLGDPRFMDCLTDLAKTLIKNKLISPDFVFLSRTESGMCNLLHILKARVHTTKIVREFIPITKKGGG
jgi:predicted unusual protein kinase regulating ubiquinone biosynthesis (AarF/ABC1/UbiB family)